MTEELKQKAIDFIRKTKEREYHLVSDYTDEQIGRFYENEINLMIGFATEATKELQEENKQLKLKIDALSNEVPWKDILEKNEQIKELVEQIEKMKRCSNCKYRDGVGFNEEPCINCSQFDEWEFAE